MKAKPRKTLIMLEKNNESKAKKAQSSAICRSRNKLEDFQTSPASLRACWTENKRKEISFSMGKMAECFVLLFPFLYIDIYRSKQLKVRKKAPSKLSTTWPAKAQQSGPQNQG